MKRKVETLLGRNPKNLKPFIDLMTLFSRITGVVICAVVLCVTVWLMGGWQTALADSPIVHFVKHGETLTAISRKYAVSLGELMRLNRIGKNGLIYPGQRLTIPAKPAAAPIPSATLRLGNVPLWRQRQSLTCEEAAAAMASRGRFSESELVRVMPHSPNPFEGIRGRTNARVLGTLTDYGTYAQGLRIGLQRLNVPSRVLYRQPYSAFKTQIIEELKAGRPVVWWTTFRQSRQTPVYVKLPDGRSVKMTRWEHTVVIVGMNERGFIYHDPFDATVRFVSSADHQRTSAYFDNMALVID